ncbi:hypothetical protein GOODEAATRI_008352, partial [Goodea atripinnis]
RKEVQDKQESKGGNRKQERKWKLNPLENPRSIVKRRMRDTRSNNQLKATIKAKGAFLKPQQSCRQILPFYTALMQEFMQKEP